MPENLLQDRQILMRDACIYHGVKRHSIMRWIEQRKVGKLWRIKTAELDELIINGDASEQQVV